MSLVLVSWWSVADAHAQQSWSQPVALFNDDGHVSDPLLIADPAGDVHLFFRWSERFADASMAPAVLMYARHHAGGWTTPVDVLTSPDRENLNHPAVALDDRGFMHIAWSSAPSGKVYYSRAHVTQLASPAAWSAPSLLSESAAVASAFGSPLAVVAIDGLLTMVYAGTDGTVRSRASIDEGVTWGPAVTVAVSAGTESLPDQVRIAVDSSGRLHVTWSQLRQPEAWPPIGVFYSRSVDRGQTWSPPSRIAGGDYGLPNIAIAPSGIVHRIWHGTAGGTGLREHQWSIDGGQTWTTPQSFIGQRGGLTGYSPLAFDSTGRLHLVTSVTGRPGRGTEEILYTSWDGATWDTPTRLSTGAIGKRSVEEPSLAISSGNLLHVAFEDDFQRVWYTTLLLPLPDAPRVQIPPPPAREQGIRASSSTPVAQTLPTPNAITRASNANQAAPALTEGQPFGPLAFASIVAAVLVAGASLAHFRLRRQS